MMKDYQLRHQQVFIAATKFATWNLSMCLCVSVISTATFANLAHAEANWVAITNDNSNRYISSNGIPRSHGRFPNPNTPYAIISQNYNFKIPLEPSQSEQVTFVKGDYIFGVATNGVPFISGAYLDGDNNLNWSKEAIKEKGRSAADLNTAGVKENGEYYYNGLASELIVGQPKNQHSGIIGYAADGFPIYANYGYEIAADPTSNIKRLYPGYSLLRGARPAVPGGNYDGTYTQDYVYRETRGDLDECNGRFGVTPEYPAGIYYYVITEDFPYVPRCFVGSPDPSFLLKPQSATQLASQKDSSKAQPQQSIQVAIQQGPKAVEAPTTIPASVQPSITISAPPSAAIALPEQSALPAPQQPVMPEPEQQAMPTPEQPAMPALPALPMSAQPITPVIEQQSIPTIEVQTTIPAQTQTELSSEINVP